MAFQGYLLKNTETNRIFPNNYIIVDSYDSTPNQRTEDKNSYTDGDGKKHISVLPHTYSGVELDTRRINLSEKIEIQSFFPDRESVMLEYWNDETNQYETGEFRVPDLTFRIYDITETDIIYNQVHIVFEEY